MVMKMYSTSSSNNVINKVLKNEQTYSIKFKDKTSIINPTVIINSETNNLVINSNYAYIPDFNRYYFVEQIELFPNNIYYVTLKCDVLESYKNDILVSKGYISQQSKNINEYYNSDYRTEVRKEIDKYSSDKTVPINKKRNILVTIGGV